MQEPIKVIDTTPVFIPMEEEVKTLVAQRIKDFDATYRKYKDVLRDHRSSYVSPALTAEQVYEKILIERSKGITHLSTGVYWFDRFAGPLRRGNTYVLCGYPGVGKTTLALILAWNMAKSGIKVWYYCLELSAREVFEVLAGHILGKANITEEDETMAYAMIQGTGFRFYEPAGYLSADQKIDELMDVTRKEDIQCIFIDNLGFMTRSMKNTFEVEGVVSARLKSLSQELEIPIVILHHLRKPESDQLEPEPNPHAIKGSGAILADASDAFILHHPLLGEGETTRDQVGFLLSGKPRWGAGGKTFVRLIGHKRLYEPAMSVEYVQKRKGRKVFE